MLSSVEVLRERLGKIRPERGRFATGSALDGLLPGNSFRRGTLIEFLGGGTTLALLVARQSLRTDGVVVAIDAARRFYPPGAARLGIDLDRLIVLQPQTPDWFVCQALACPAVDAVVCWPSRVGSVMFRRWQLAAERGGSVGLLIRPQTARGSPSWADLRILVQPRAINHWRLELLHGRSLEIAIDDEGRIHDCLHLVSELADPVPAPRSA